MCAYVCALGPVQTECVCVRACVCEVVRAHLEHIPFLIRMDVCWCAYEYVWVGVCVCVWWYEHCVITSHFSLEWMCACWCMCVCVCVCTD